MNILKYGYSISNIDSVIISQRPKLQNIYTTMQLSISDIYKININVIGIKTKTKEGNVQ